MYKNFIVDLKKKNEPDFETLLSPHLGSLYKVAYRFTGNKVDAEDLVQDLLVKLYSRRKELQDVKNMRSWLIRVLYRQFIDNTRKHKRSPLDLVFNRSDAKEDHIINSIEYDGPNPEDRLNNIYLTKKIENALNKLNKDQRSVLVLHDIEGYKLNELEILLDIPLGTLKSRVHRARSKLREIIQKDGTFQRLLTSR